MPRPRPPAALFVVAAGPRIGFGHLVRCRSLARAMGVPPVVLVRGTSAIRRRAATQGWRVVETRTDGDVRALGPRLLVIDDPSSAAVRAWVQRGRRLRIPVATVHDLGIAATASDLVIDASLFPARGVRGRHGTLHGPAYAILDPAVAAVRERSPRRMARAGPAAPRPRVLVALGGGRTAPQALRVAAAVAARVDADVRIVRGFVGGRRPPAPARCRWIDARDGLARVLATAAVVVVAGGVTLYEACALGIPAVALPLNAAQGITIRAVARRGAALGARDVAHAAGLVQRVLGDPAARRRLSLAGRRLVDGRGAVRVAARLRQLGALASDKVGNVA